MRPWVVLGFSNAPVRGTPEVGVTSDAGVVSGHKQPGSTSQSEGSDGESRKKWSRDQLIFTHDIYDSNGSSSFK